MTETIRTIAVYDEFAEYYSAEKEIHLAKKQILGNGTALVGFLLCFTGIGIIIGIPMIIWASMNLSANKSSTAIGKGCWKGDCPVCKAHVLLNLSKNINEYDFKCPTCNISIKLYSGEYLHTPSV